MIPLYTLLDLAFLGQLTRGIPYGTGGGSGLVTFTYSLFGVAVRDFQSPSYSISFEFSLNGVAV